MTPNPVVPLPPPNIVNRPDAVQAWYFNLSPVDRGRYLDHLESLIAAMPPRRKQLFQMLYDRMKARVPSPLPVTVTLGNWGAFAGALTAAAMQVGVSVYNTKEQADLQKDLAAGNQETQQLIAKLQAEAQLEAQKAMINAETEAARIAAQAQIDAAKTSAGATIERARIRGDFWGQHGTSLILAGGGLLLAAVGGVFLIRRKKGRR